MVNNNLTPIFQKEADNITHYNVSTENQLKLYGLYKQAIIGNINCEEPGLFDLKGRAKYDAWNKLKGMSKENAMREYIILAKKIKKDFYSKLLY